MSLSVFSQTSSTRNNIDFPDSLGYGMIVDGVDTFAIMHVQMIKKANNIFVERNYYRDLSDSLRAIDILKDGKLKIKNNIIESLRIERNRYIVIADLEKGEADDCEEKYEKLVKKYERSRKGNKFLGGATGVAIIVIAILLI